MRFIILIFVALLLGACAAHPQKAAPESAPAAKAAQPLQASPGPKVRAIAIGTLSNTEFELETGQYFTRNALTRTRAAGKLRAGDISETEAMLVLSLTDQARAKLSAANRLALQGRDQWAAARELYQPAIPMIEEAEGIVNGGTK